jgi:hypothetical protein
MVGIKAGNLRFPPSPRQNHWAAVLVGGRRAGADDGLLIIGYLRVARPWGTAVSMLLLDPWAFAHTNKTITH